MTCTVMYRRGTLTAAATMTVRGGLFQATALFSVKPFPIAVTRSAGSDAPSPPHRGTPPPGFRPRQL